MKLNKKKVAVLGLAGLLALGGAGGALAYIIKNDSKTHKVTNESAVMLSWKDNSASLEIETLTPAAPVYKEIGFDISKSNAATGSAIVQIQVKNNTPVLETGETLGSFKVSVSNESWSTTIENRKSVVLYSSGTGDYLNQATYSFPFGSAASKKLYLKFETNYTSDNADVNIVLDGSATASLAYSVNVLEDISLVGSHAE